MSRSSRFSAANLKKTLISGMTKSESEKADKKIWHAHLRNQERCHLNTVLDETSAEQFLPKGEKNYSNYWCFAKDSKRYLKNQHKNNTLTGIENDLKRTPYHRLFIRHSICSHIAFKA
jgi:hypothetical protein